MKILFWVLALGLLLPIPVAAENPPLPRVQLWNGRDLTGWTSFFKAGVATPLHFWNASQGVLHLDKTPAGYIRTDKSYANYRLHMEWRWPEPLNAHTQNSGIFVRQQPPDAVWPSSVQVQVKTGFCGDLIAQGGLTFAPKSPLLILKKLAPPSEKPNGEWNSTDIDCRSTSIEVFVNGVRQNFVDQLPSGPGQIALQMEGCPIEFRNLWLQPLD